MKTSELFGYALSREVHKLAYPDEPIKEGCTAPPYASDWAFGGPIIEQESINLETYRDGWRAARYVTARRNSIEPTYGYGPTPLIAAMRSFVASKLGDDVEIPEELL